jgi:hypothetical protein
MAASKPALGRLTAAALVALAKLLISSCGTASTTRRVVSGCGSFSAAATSSVSRAVRHLHALPSSRVPIDGQPLEYGFGAVWSASSSGLVELSVPGGEPRILVREPIDDVALFRLRVRAVARHGQGARTGSPHETRHSQLGVDQGSRSLVGAPHAVYVAYASETTGVQRIDLSTGAVTRSPVPNATGLANDHAIAYGAGRPWLADTGTIYRLDPTRLSVNGSAGLAVSDIWFGDGSLWAASDSADGGVERISPNTGQVTARVNSDAMQIAFSPEMVWLASARGPTAVQADTAHRVVTLPPQHVLDDDSADIAVVGNQVWTTYADLRRLQRLVPSRRPPSRRAKRPCAPCCQRGDQRGLRAQCCGCPASEVRGAASHADSRAQSQMSIDACDGIDAPRCAEHARAP